MKNTQLKRFIHEALTKKLNENSQSTEDDNIDILNQTDENLDEAEAEEEEIEVNDAPEEGAEGEESTEEFDSEEAPDIEGEPSGNIKGLQDSLEAALEAAREIGDEKLVDQIGNTITFFTRTHVVKETKLNEEVKRFQKLAGIIKG